MFRVVLVNLLALFLMTGCKAATTNQVTDTPARIKVHSQASLAELRATIRTALNNRDVLIASNAFTTSSRLIISRKPIKGPDGRIIDSRTPEEPVIFNLLLNGKRCFVVDKRDARRYELKSATCEATG